MKKAWVTAYEIDTRGRFLKARKALESLGARIIKERHDDEFEAAQAVFVVEIADVATFRMALNRSPQAWGCALV